MNPAYLSKDNFPSDNAAEHLGPNSIGLTRDLFPLLPEAPSRVFSPK